MSPKSQAIPDCGLFEGSSPPGSTSAKHPPQSDQSLEEWYYQLDQRTHGPLTLSALLDLIGTSGDTAQEVVVRQGADGVWVPFNSLPGLSLLPAPASRPDGPRHACATSTISARGRAPAWSIRQLIGANCDVAVGLAVWLLINGVIFVAWTQAYATERGYFATLRSLEKENKAIRASDATGRDWAVFRARVKQTLAPMIAHLKKRASPSEPIRQHLLWAARDQFPKCIGPPSRESSEPERLYQHHMQVVEEELAKQ